MCQDPWQGLNSTDTAHCFSRLWGLMEETDSWEGNCYTVWEAPQWRKYTRNIMESFLEEEAPKARGSQLGLRSEGWNWTEGLSTSLFSGWKAGLFLFPWLLITGTHNLWWQELRFHLSMSLQRLVQKNQESQRDFHGGPVVKTPCFQYREHRFDPWLGN